MVEQAGGVCIARTSTGDEDAAAGGARGIEFPVTDVPGQVAAVRRNLDAVIDLVREWARSLVPEHADALAARIADAWGLGGAREVIGER
jgi:hypothetical protein